MSYRTYPNGEVIHCDLCDSNPSVFEIELMIGKTYEPYEICGSCNQNLEGIEAFRLLEEKRIQKGRRP